MPTLSHWVVDCNTAGVCGLGLSGVQEHSTCGVGLVARGLTRYHMRSSHVVISVHILKILPSECSSQSLLQGAGEETLHVSTEKRRLKSNEYKELLGINKVKRSRLLGLHLMIIFTID